MVKPASLRKHYRNGLFDPVRLHRKILTEAKSNGEFYYSGQFLQHPVPAGGLMFKIERIRIDTPPAEWKTRVRYWDKAGSHDSGAYTVGVLIGKDKNDHLWILDVVRGQWDAAAREARIKQTALLDGKTVVVGVEQEPGSGGKESAENTVKNLLGYRVRLDRPTGDKVLRADPFAAQVNASNVSMASGPWNAAYLEELEYFPQSRYKDQVDASSGACSLLSNAGYGIGVMGVW